MKILIVLLISTVGFTEPTRWQKFCAKHLIADDPYQFESYSNDTIIDMLDAGIKSAVLNKEARSRLSDLSLHYEERERLRAALHRAKVINGSK